MASHSKTTNLGGDDLGAVALEAADRRLLALRLAGAEGVADEVDAAAEVEEAEHGLEDADVRLAAGDHEGRAVREGGLRESRLPAGVEVLLLEHAMPVREARHRGPESLRVLLGEEDRDLE